MLALAGTDAALSARRLVQSVAAAEYASLVKASVTARTGDRIVLPAAPEGVSVQWRLQQGDILHLSGDGVVISLAHALPGTYTLVTEISGSQGTVLTRDTLLKIEEAGTSAPTDQRM